MKDRRVDRLASLTTLIRDHELGQLRAAVARRELTVALRDGLTVQAGGDGTVWKAQIDYARWVEQRRAALEKQISQQDQQIAAQMIKARLAFARADVLAKLRSQLS